MAKTAFSKLGLTKNQNIKTIKFNEQEIEVKQYLPVNEKLTLISNIINSSLAEDSNFFNPVKMGVFTTLEILYAYTNLSFTEKQKEDPSKLYDLVIANGLVKEVINAIPIREYTDITSGINSSVGAVYNYRNSIMGILEAISQDYSNLNFDASEIQKKLADPDNLALLKSIMTKLG